MDGGFWSPDELFVESSFLWEFWRDIVAPPETAGVPPTAEGHMFVETTEALERTGDLWGRHTVSVVLTFFCDCWWEMMVCPESSVVASKSVGFKEQAPFSTGIEGPECGVAGREPGETSGTVEEAGGLCKWKEVDGRLLATDLLSLELSGHGRRSGHCLAYSTLLSLGFGEFGAISKCSGVVINSSSHFSTNSWMFWLNL